MRNPRTSLTKEPVMGILAWIVLGLGAGLLANMMISGRRQQGLILICLTGVAGALAGGWAATQIFHLHYSLQEFFNASTWLSAIGGAAILLLAYHLATVHNRPVSPSRPLRASAVFSPVSLLLVGLGGLALHLAGVGTGWSMPRPGRSAHRALRFTPLATRALERARGARGSALRWWFRPRRLPAR
jgi:uncharacterized membrane protein YeaQ/YmgE (transglycosylase-associated protein family)